MGEIVANILCAGILGVFCAGFVTAAVVSFRDERNERNTR
jgi:hypothetical protein